VRFGDGVMEGERQGRLKADQWRGGLRRAERGGFPLDGYNGTTILFSLFSGFFFFIIELS